MLEQRLYERRVPVVCTARWCHPNQAEPTPGLGNSLDLEPFGSWIGGQVGPHDDQPVELDAEPRPSGTARVGPCVGSAIFARSVSRRCGELDNDESRRVAAQMGPDGCSLTIRI